MEHQPQVTPSPSGHGRVAVACAVIAVAAVHLALWNRRAAVQKAEIRLTIPLPPGQEITSYPAITRDGRTVAYVTQQGTEDAQLYLRDLNSFEARAVAGSSGARQPFFSPDGKWVAFFAQGQLQKAEVAGGAPIRLAEAPVPFGGTWSDDNTIIYAGSIDSGLMRIPANGGTPESLTKPDGAAQGYAHVFPQVLPGGRSVLFTIWGQEPGSWVLSLDSHRWEMVLPVGAVGATMFDAAGGSTGRLLIIDQAAGIKAAPFDPAHPARTSANTSVLSNVYYDIEIEQRGWLDVSNTGTAVYAPGNPAKTSLVWVDREGKTESLGKDQDAYRVRGGFRRTGPRQRSGMVTNFGYMICNAEPAAASRRETATILISFGAVMARGSSLLRIAVATGTFTPNPPTGRGPRKHCSSGPTLSTRSRFWPTGPCCTRKSTPRPAGICGPYRPMGKPRPCG